jgi:hypothetical protein
MTERGWLMGTNTYLLRQRSSSVLLYSRMTMNYDNIFFKVRRKDFECLYNREIRFALIWTLNNVYISFIVVGGTFELRALYLSHSTRPFLLWYSVLLYVRPAWIASLLICASPGIWDDRCVPPAMPGLASNLNPTDLCLQIR